MNFIEIMNKDQNLAIFVLMAGLKETDVHLIQSAAPQVLALLPEVVTRFLQHLKAVPEVEQRLTTAHQNFPQHLTHWLGNLFTGPHDQQFLEAQHQEGSNNVQKRIPPLYTAFAMSFFRAALPQLLGTHGVSQQYSEGALTAAILRMLDLCQYLTDRAYTARLLEVTGISKTLLDRLMTV